MNEGRNPARIYVSRLVNEYHYPARFVQEEAPYSFDRARYRIDVLVLQDGQPYIVAETKERPNLPGNLDQLQGLLRATNAEFGVITNGFVDSCYRNPRDSLDTKLHPIPDIPQYGKTLQDIGTHKNSELVKIAPERFREIIIHVRDSISEWGRSQGFSTDETARELTKVLLLKTYDETLHEGLFRAMYGEPPENVRSRIVALAMKAREKYPLLLKEPHNLSDQLLSVCVFSLQRYSLHDSGIEIPIEELLGLSGHEFLTRKDLTRMMIDLLNPSTGSSFIDPACGAGGFVTEAARRGCRVTGIEINASIAQYAQLNLVLAGSTGRILIRDSLRSSIRSEVGESNFDFAAVDPPLGGKIDDNRLDNFDLGTQKKTQRTEALFLEITLRFLKPSGKMIMTVPDGFLATDSSLDAREFALREAAVKAIISLPKGALYSSAVKSSLLVLERSPERGTTATDPVFVAFLEDFAEAERIVSAYRAFEKGELKRSKEFFVAQITSARQMNASFLQATYADLRKQKDSRQLVGLYEVASLTAGVQLDKIGRRDSRGKYYYARAGNVGEFVINLSETDRVTATQGHSVDKWIAKPGDILMTRAGTVGRTALVTNDCPPILIGSNVTKIAVRPDQIMPEFVLAFLLSKEGLHQINMHTNTGTIKSISTSSLGQIKVPLPPMEQQREIAQHVKKIIEAKRETKRVIEDMSSREKQLHSDLEELLAVKI